MDEPTSAAPECSADGCARVPRNGKTGPCNAHYFQLRRHGQITSPVIRERRDGCQEPGCDKPHAALGWCEMHYTRWSRHGDPQTRLPTCAEQPMAGPDHPKWKGDAIGYTGTHARVRSQRGPASAHLCAECGAPARQWSYDHTDPNERTAPQGPYSTDPARYRPLCVPCHTRFDRSRPSG
jgi:hypothetical protein